MHLPFLFDFFDIFAFFSLGIFNFCNSINIPLQSRRYLLFWKFLTNQAFYHNPRFPIIAFCFLFQCHYRTYILSQNVCNKNKTIFFIKHLWNDPRASYEWTISIIICIKICIICIKIWNLEYIINKFYHFIFCL